MTTTPSPAEFESMICDDPAFSLLLGGLVRRAHDYNAEQAEESGRGRLNDAVLADMVGRLAREQFRGDSTIVTVTAAKFPGGADAVTVALNPDAF